MIPEEIYDLFDEFYFLEEPLSNKPVKRNEIIEEIHSVFKFSGTNQNKTLWVYNDINQLSDEDNLMIENLIVKGLGWNKNDVILLDLNENKGYSFVDIKTFFKPSFIILWGCDQFLYANSIQFKPHEIFIENDLRILTVLSIESYKNNPILKKTLWESIKQLFSIK